MENLSLEVRNKLEIVLDLIIPNKAEMPGASFILDYIDFGNHINQEFINYSRIICEKLDISNLKGSFEELKKTDFRLISEFVNLVLIMYYSNTQVLENLNIGSVPPFPNGNQLKQGDIYLLEQVFLKGKVYRD